MEDISKEVQEFLKEIEIVCKKHKLSIVPEQQGLFIIEDYHEILNDLLKQSGDESRYNNNIEGE